MTLWRARVVIEEIRETFMRSIRAFVAAFATNAMLDRDKSRRALAALDNSQLSNLSDLGRQIRCEAQRERSQS